MKKLKIKKEKKFQVEAKSAAVDSPILVQFKSRIFHLIGALSINGRDVGETKAEPESSGIPFVDVTESIFRYCMGDLPFRASCGL